MKFKTRLVLLFALFWAADAALAEDPAKKWRADAGRGKSLALKLCANCHVVSEEQQAPAIAGIPTFRAIANLPDRDANHLTNTLLQPHAPMPDVRLTRHEIGDLLAYIGRFRENKPAPNKSAPKKKPVYPSPS